MTSGTSYLVYLMNRLLGVAPSAPNLNTYRIVIRLSPTHSRCYGMRR